MIEAFFPDKEVKKTKVQIVVKPNGSCYFKTLRIYSQCYTSKKNAIKGAKRFCKRIDSECDIINYVQCTNKYRKDKTTIY